MSPRSLLKLAQLALLLALLVVLMGGWTRLNDAGLSCPDWPGCYGELVLPADPVLQSTAQLRYPEQPLDLARGWLEMGHRYLAGSLGLLIAAVAVAGWRHRLQRGYPLGLSIGLLALVVLQALFGMWTVTLKLLPQVVTLHLLGGLMTLGLQLRLCQRLHAWERGLKTRPRDFRWLLGIGAGLLLLQIALGGWTSANYAGWSCSHWWSCERQASPRLDFEQAFSLPSIRDRSYLGGHLPREARAAIQMSHRGMGLALAAYLLTLAWLMVRRYQAAKAAGLLLGVLLTQLLLGIFNVIYGLPLLLAMAHHVGAVLLWGVLVWLYGRLGFRREEVNHG